MTKFKVQSTDDPSFYRIFTADAPDVEGYRTVRKLEIGEYFSHYGDWNTISHPTFQSWMDYIFRPGTTRVTEITDK